MTSRRCLRVGCKPAMLYRISFRPRSGSSRLGERYLICRMPTVGAGARTELTIQAGQHLRSHIIYHISHFVNKEQCQEEKSTPSLSSPRAPMAWGPWHT